MVIDGGSGRPDRKGTTPRRPATRRAPRLEAPQTLLRLPDDPYEVGVPRRPGRGRGVLALAAVTVVVAAAIAVSTHRNSGKNAPAAGTTASGQQPQSVAGVGGGVLPASATAGQQVGNQAYNSSAFPSGTQNNVLIGYPDTKEGAAAAAANYVAVYGSDLMMNPVKRHGVIRTIANPAIEPALQTQLDQAFGLAAQGFGLDKNGKAPNGQTFLSRAFPAGVSVSTYSNSKATVAVWVNTIAGTAGDGSTHPVAESWATVTLNLTWTNNDWKWDSFTQVDGPTPVGSSQQVSAPGDIQKAAQEFARLKYAP